VGVHHRIPTTPQKERGNQAKERVKKNGQQRKRGSNTRLIAPSVTGEERDGEGTACLLASSSGFEKGDTFEEGKRSPVLSEAVIDASFRKGPRGGRRHREKTRPGVISGERKGGSV